VRLRLTITLAAVLVAAAVAVTHWGPNTEPIVGFWSWHDSVLQVKAVGSGSFEGSVVERAAGACRPTVGHVVLRVTGSGAHYAGGDEWYRQQDCAARFSTDARIDLTDGNAIAMLCSTGPFADVAPVEDCVDLQRIVDYVPGLGG
jgi:hypothetical protein